MDRSTNRTDEIGDQLERSPLGTAENQRRIEDKLDAIPTTNPTVVVSQIPGPAGAPGQPGKPGAAGKVRTVVVTVTPAPAPQADRSVPRPALGPRPAVTVTATPACRTEFAGICLAR